MSDPHHPAGVARPQGMFWWLRGRSSRREYWLYIAVLFGLSFLLSHAPPAVNLVFTATMLFVQIRRVHDFGRSGWWAVAAVFAPLLPVVPLFYFYGEMVAVGVGVVVELALIALVGAIPGDPGDNRFGPPPAFTARRVLTGR